MLWYGSVASIPSGWVLCDGNNSTPDLRERFVVGAGGNNSTVSGNGYSVNDKGGFTDATLVSHSHTINNHTHSFSGSASHSHTINNHTHTFSATTGSDSHSHSYSSANHPSSSGPEQDQSGGPENRTQFNVGKTTGSDSHSHSVSGTTGNPSNTGTNSQTVSISGNTGNPSNTGTNSQGSSATNKNLPPYYALCYIMKT